MTAELRDSLAQVQELLGRATPGEWHAECYCDGAAIVQPGRGEIPMGNKVDGEPDMEDAEAIAAAVNWLREHGPELMKMLDRHGAGDADRSAELTTAWIAGAESVRDRSAEDSARLDYIERTFSGVTNRERYLPVTMIWGKGANGRTLREACDKYMAKDAARAGERGATCES